MKSQTKQANILLEHVSNLMKLLPMYVLFITIAFFFCMQVHIAFPIKGYFLFAFGVISTYFIRYYVKRIFPYIILHVFLLPAMTVIGHCPLLIFLSLLFCVLFYIYAYHFWRSDEVGVVLKLPVTFVIACFFFYLLSLQRGNSMYSPYFFTLSILYVLASIVANYVIRLEAYVIENQHNDSISLKRVLLRNTRSGMMLLVILILLALIGNIPFFQEITYQFFHTIYGFLQKTIQSLFANFNTSSTEAIQPSPSTLVEAPPHITTRDTSLFAKVLHYIFVIMGYCLLIFLVGSTIWKALKILTSSKQKRLRKESKEEYDGIQEIRSKLEQPKKMQRTHFRRKTPKDKIREQYFKTIIGYEKQGYEIKENHSPLERNADIQKEFQEDLSLLTKEYEAVRYNKTE